jgi:spermidine synthase
LLGFVTFVTQVIILREFLTFFNGNELIIGVILATWMLLTGSGAYLGRFIKRQSKTDELLMILIGSLGFLPIITVLGLHFFSTIFFTPGVMLGLSEAFIYTLIILSPFCIISGMLFPLFAEKVSVKSYKNIIGSLYAWESIGSLIGGLILNFFLIWVLSTFQSLFVVMFITVVTISVLGLKSGNYFIVGIFVFIFLIFSFLFISNNLDKSVRELSYPDQVVEYIDETPYGIIVVTDHEGQINYYENNILMGTSGDVALREESVHFAMVQHQKPEKILVLSGIINGIISEILKYPVKEIDYVDVNPGVIDLAKKFLDLDTLKNVNLIEKDPIRYLRKTSNKYDVVLINLPTPSTIQLNRFYTVEFYAMLKKKLNKDAVVCLSSPSSSNYLNEQAQDLLSVIISSLRSQFKNVLVLPGTDDFILASDQYLFGNISERIELTKIKNHYVNSYYIHDDLLVEKSKIISNQIDSQAPLNYDFKPVVYQSTIKLWLSFFNLKYWIPAFIIILLSAFFYLRTGTFNKAVFAAGFAGTSIELLLLFVFQVFYGYVYFAAGIFFMLFMAGLSLGSFCWPVIFKSPSLKLIGRLVFCIIVFMIILHFVFKLFKIMPFSETMILTVFIMLVMIISVLTGVIFSISTHLRKTEVNIVASEAYGFDLLGSAAGALLLSVYLVPVLGFELSLIGTGLVCILTLFFILRESRIQD